MAKSNEKIEAVSPDIQPETTNKISEISENANSESKVDNSTDDNSSGVIAFIDKKIKELEQLLVDKINFKFSDFADSLKQEQKQEQKQEIKELPKW